MTVAQAWRSFENYLSCEGIWPRIQGKTSSSYMKKRNSAMKWAFMEGWKAKTKDKEYKRIQTIRKKYGY
jgi:hypothetical protein